MEHYTCSVCHQRVEGDLVVYIHHTEIHIVNEIKKKHPDWECSEGLCPKCLECFRNAIQGKCST